MHASSAAFAERPARSIGISGGGLAMALDPTDFLASIKVGPVVVDFGKDHWMEIAGVIIVVLALYLGVRLIDRFLPARKNPDT